MFHMVVESSRLIDLTGRPAIGACSSFATRWLKVGSPSLPAPRWYWQCRGSDIPT